MATRRHRTVFKPNIRPAATKTSTPVVARSRTTSISIYNDTPSPAVKEKHSEQSSEDIIEPEKEDESKEPILLENSSSQHEGQVLTQTDTVSEKQKTTPVQEVKCGAQGQEEIAVSSIDEGAINDKSEQICSNSEGSLPTSLTGKSLQTTIFNCQPKDSFDLPDGTPADGDKSQEEIAPVSESAESCISEAVSLEAEDERRGDMEVEAQKKPRRHRSKKQRTEALPSREKSPDRQKMKMSDLLSWNPQQNFLPKKNKKKPLVKDENQPVSPSPSDVTDKESSNQSTALPAPQVMIGPDGSVVLNTESLLIHAAKDESMSKEIIEEDDDDRYLNTNTYRKYKKTKLWTETETEKFFMGLSMCGTDFSLLTNLLPHRSRRELKNKFRREERRNRPLIDKALANRQQYDTAPFLKMADEEEKDKKDVKKRMKKEKLVPEKKSAKTGKRKLRRKRKQNEESEDEEDDWGPGYDEEDEENQDGTGGNIEETVGALVVKPSNKPKRATVKKEVVYPNKIGPFTNVHIEEKTDLPFVPATPQILTTVSSQYDKCSDLHQPYMRSPPTKTYSRYGTEHQVNSLSSSGAADINNTASVSSCNTSGIQTIPGSTQVQIEMEGVRNPVQGVLIPSHMVPQIAPQLGIQGNTSGMQVLLVQEDTGSGSLVHVYVIPEAQGPSQPTSHPALASPIPSPHPTTPIPSQHPGPLSPNHKGPAHTPLQSPHLLQVPAPEVLVRRPPPHTMSSSAMQLVSNSSQNVFLSSGSTSIPSEPHQGRPADQAAGSPDPQLSLVQQQQMSWTSTNTFSRQIASHHQQFKESSGLPNSATQHSVTEMMIARTGPTIDSVSAQCASDDDCIIVNSDHPKSRLDTSGFCNL